MRNKCGIVALLVLASCATPIDTINRKVNEKQYITGKYDCKNYATDKYYELVRAGYKNDDMRFVITSYKGKPHMVLLVTTS